MVKKSATVMFLFVWLFGIWMGGCETQEQKVERLIKQLGHKKVKVRVSAARALGLGSIRSEDAIDAVPALIKALQDKDEYVRVNAAWALRQIRQKH